MVTIEDARAELEAVLDDILARAPACAVVSSSTGSGKTRLMGKKLADSNGRELMVVKSKEHGRELAAHMPGVRVLDITQPGTLTGKASDGQRSAILYHGRGESTCPRAAAKQGTDCRDCPFTEQCSATGWLRQRHLLKEANIVVVPHAMLKRNILSYIRKHAGAFTYVIVDEDAALATQQVTISVTLLRSALGAMSQAARDVLYGAIDGGLVTVTSRETAIERVGDVLKWLGGSAAIRMISGTIRNELRRDVSEQSRNALAALHDFLLLRERGETVESTGRGFTITGLEVPPVFSLSAPVLILDATPLAAMQLVQYGWMPDAEIHRIAPDLPSNMDVIHYYNRKLSVGAEGAMTKLAHIWFFLGTLRGRVVVALDSTVIAAFYRKHLPTEYAVCCIGAVAGTDKYNGYDHVVYIGNCDPPGRAHQNAIDRLLRIRATTATKLYDLDSRGVRRYRAYQGADVGLFMGACAGGLLVQLAGRLRALLRSERGAFHAFTQLPVAELMQRQGFVANYRHMDAALILPALRNVTDGQIMRLLPGAAAKKLAWLLRRYGGWYLSCAWLLAAAPQLFPSQEAAKDFVAELNLIECGLLLPFNGLAGGVRRRAARGFFYNAAFAAAASEVGVVREPTKQAQVEKLLSVVKLAGCMDCEDLLSIAARSRLMHRNRTIAGHALDSAISQGALEILPCGTVILATPEAQLELEQRWKPEWT